MKLSNKQLQTLTQKQRLTIKQQYHLKLLSFNEQQLVKEIEQQVENNPLLECDESFLQGHQYDQESFYEQSLRYVCKEKTLQEELIAQCHTYPDPLPEDLTTYLIESLDENGYLRIDMKTIEEDTGYKEEDIEEVIAVLQTFEPLGVCARDLQESLLIQLCDESIPHSTVAIQIVNDHLDLLALNKLKDIANCLQVRLEDVKEAVALIRSLQPKPGAKYARISNYVFPEAVISIEDDELHIALANQHMPLSINRSYEESDDLILQTYVKKHTKDAQMLIDGLAKRQETLGKILQFIVSYQTDFFLHNAQLKPLTLMQVAQAIGMHESTISRCVSSKSIEFQQQIYPLKYFFPAQLESGQSNNEIQLRIKEMIAKEDKHKPLSDQQMADLLEKEHIHISRRAIAKYRDQLQIPAASKRKIF